MFSTRQEILAFCGSRRLIPAFTRGFLKIRFIIILSTPESFSGLSSLDFPIKTFYVPLLSLMSCLCHPSWFDHSNDIWWGVHSIKLPVTQFSHLGPNMLLSTLLKALREQHKNAESFNVLSGIRPHGLSAGRPHSYCAQPLRYIAVATHLMCVIFTVTFLPRWFARENLGLVSSPHSQQSTYDDAHATKFAACVLTPPPVWASPHLLGPTAAAGIEIRHVRWAVTFQVVENCHKETWAVFEVHLSHSVICYW